MMLVSIEPAGARGVDLHTFECAICNRVLETFAAYEDPMKSKGLGRCKARRRGPAGMMATEADHAAFAAGPLHNKEVGRER